MLHEFDCHQSVKVAWLLAGVAPEMNLRNSSCAGDKTCKRGGGRGINCGPTERTDVLQKFKKVFRGNFSNLLTPKH